MPRPSVTLAAAFLAATIGAGSAALFQPSSSWQVRYSPRGGCTELAVRTISEARESVLVQAYSFTSAPIAEALMAAHRRGVKVEIVLDRCNLTDPHSQAKDCVAAGIPVRIDSKHPIAHNKIFLVDGKIVLTGSFNLSAAAEQNAENLLRIDDLALAARYVANWNEHREHSAPYQP